MRKIEAAEVMQRASHDFFEVEIESVSVSFGGCVMEENLTFGIFVLSWRNVNSRCLPRQTVIGYNCSRQQSKKGRYPYDK